MQRTNCTSAALEPWNKGAFETGKYRNLLAEMGYKQHEIEGRLEFVDHLWKSRHEPYDDGYFDAYYDGLLQLFAYMHLSVNYRIIFPQNVL
ncbi:MAG TPA: hypothetical protein PLH60_02790 [Proteiniphilum sp.]|nr:hypothetical protein [Proteiniphilum sp.]HPD86782.1 hypothetical protein [Proteiniphilum sp.]HPJ49957.1 hypothetical protein [Proteiniphilum sp.]HPR19469.1 hypothetical protein [Proteiniphilum sp.]